MAAANFALQPALAWNAAPEQQAWSALACTTMVDAASGKALEHSGSCGVRITPVSTFNIAVSLMGYDSGILQDQHAPLLPFKPGYVDWQPSWRQALDPAGWIRTSSVWYAQQVTAGLGPQRFQRYVQAFGYGNRDVAGDPGANNGLRMAWIDSSLKISADEQAGFLRRLVNRELGVSTHAYDMTAALLRLDVQADGWQVYGKTGSGYPVNADGTEDREHAYGWFVGWASKNGRTIVFAQLQQDRKDEPRAAGPRVRDAFLRTLPARLAAAP
ncbi:class D beta-lactamase [Oxalobacteraceae bacterium A2-2]